MSEEIRNVAWEALTEIWICPECGELYEIDTETRQPLAWEQTWERACCYFAYHTALDEQAGREAEDE